MSPFVWPGLRGVWIALLILVWVATPGTGQRLQDAPNSSSQSPSHSPQNDDERTHIFTGRIVSSKGRVMFLDQATQMVYPLENEDKAKQYADKNVKVRGVLDPATNMILITDAEFAPPPR